MNVPSAIPAERWRLRASDFELLFEAGALADVRRAELIDGDIYGMSPQATLHARVKIRLAFAIKARLDSIGNTLETLTEVSVVVADDSVPEPDIVVSRYTGDGFMPADTAALIIEVSNSTLRFDLGRKAELYALAGLPEYWVVDIEGRRVVVHHQPSPSGYTRHSDVPFGEPLISATIEGLSVETGNLIF